MPTRGFHNLHQPARREACVIVGGLLNCRAASTKDQAEDEQHQEYEEQYFRDPRRPGGDTAKTKDARNECDDEK